MANKLSKDISGSVQEKRGMLYLVVSYKDRNTEKQNQMAGAWTACRLHEIAHQQGCQRGEEQV